MGRRLTPLGMVLKWLLVPAALGAAGYFLVGPEIGKSELATKVGKRFGIPLPPRTEEPVEDAESASKGKEKGEDEEVKTPDRSGPQPEVEVSAERVERPTRRRSRRRRRTNSRETRAIRFVLPTEQRSA